MSFSVGGSLPEPSSTLTTSPLQQFKSIRAWGVIRSKKGNKTKAFQRFSYQLLQHLYIGFPGTPASVRVEGKKFQMLHVWNI